MIRRPNQTRTIILLVSPAFIFVLVFFVLPLIFLLSQSVLPEDGGFTLTGYLDFFQSRVSRIVYLRTLKLGLIVTSICVVMSLPGRVCAGADACPPPFILDVAGDSPLDDQRSSTHFRVADYTGAARHD